MQSRRLSQATEGSREALESECLAVSRQQGLGRGDGKSVGPQVWVQLLGSAGGWCGQGARSTEYGVRSTP